MNNEIVNALRTIDSIERKLNKDSEIKTKDINNKLFDGIIKEYKEKCENVIKKYKNKEIDDNAADSFIRDNFNAYINDINNELNRLSKEVSRARDELTKMNSAYSKELFKLSRNR